MVDTFWIRVKGLNLCEPLEVQQFAVLSYKPTTENRVKLTFPAKAVIPYAQQTFLNDKVSFKKNIPKIQQKPFLKYFSQKYLNAFKNLKN